MESVKFNLYWSVKIRMHPKGAALLDDQTAPGMYQPDKSGHVTMKLWEFMRVFGPTVRAGRSPMFDEIMYLVPPPTYPETETIRVRL